MRRNVLIGLGAVILVLVQCLAGRAEAGTSTTTFVVNANVAVTCSIVAADLDFGTYDRTSGTPLSGTTQISVNCTSGANWDIGLNKGTNGSSVTARQMANTTNNAVRLNYSLFQDAAHTLNWGNTVGTDTVGGTGIGTTQAVTVFGLIPAGQTGATAGGYTDTITATLTF